MRLVPSKSALPLTLALQGLSFVLVGFFLAPGAPLDPSARIGSGDLPRIDAALSTDLQIPKDLERERLPVPKFPDLEEPPKERAPKPKDDSANKAPIVEGPKLASLRVSSVALAALISIDVPSPLPDAPDSLDRHELTGASSPNVFGSNSRNRRGAGNGAGPSDTGDGGSGGWGGAGIGGSGGGSGGHCPTPGGIMGGGYGGRGTSGRGGGGSVGRPAGPSGGSGGGQPAGAAGGGRGGERSGGGGSKGKSR